MTIFKAACVQMTSGPDIEKNLADAGKFVHEAKAAGADFVLLPENVCSVTNDKTIRFKNAKAEGEHPGIMYFADLARELRIFILAGSFSIRLSPDKMANRSYLFGPRGVIMGRYDKIHLFDADPKPGETYRESDFVQPGDKAMLADTPWGRLGMTVCYDVRFPHLYRKLAKAGAMFFSIPAAFTVPTGEAHWHVLMRARAIENGCYVFAPAQGGTHEGGRKTYGHSLIINPWGEILAEGGTEPGFIIAEIDTDKVATARAAIASLKHDREFTGP